MKGKERKKREGGGGFLADPPSGAKKQEREKISVCSLKQPIGGGGSRIRGEKDLDFFFLFLPRRGNREGKRGE